MWYAIIDGAPCFWTFAKSQKVVNLRRDPRITCMVEAGDEYSDLRGVELVATPRSPTTRTRCCGSASPSSSATRA